jgi:NADH-quinone oxidoreductase subunit H
MLFKSPFTIMSFFIFFIGSLAEANRIPFDLPEAESELVSGYCTEYSGFRYAVFFLSEWANLFVMGSITTVIFLGGGNLPGFVSDITLLSLAVFFFKVAIIVFIIIWIRWTLPRFRIDQLMKLSWKYLLPAAFFAFFGQALYMLLTWERPILQLVIAVFLFIVFLFTLFKFMKRVIVNLKEQNMPVNSPKSVPV